MSSELTAVIIYLAPLFLILAYYIFCRKRVHHSSLNLLVQSKKDGLTEPASLHPVIDLTKCLGCGSCVAACPENKVLGLIDRQAQLINPSNCIGHGACKTYCPQDAITLVFGTEKRGVDIPELSPDFQTNVTGLFIAGELGGMGLIKNAIEQGRQAMDSVERYLQLQSKFDQNLLDCVIVGAGPAGISAMLGAKEKNLNIVTIDQDVAGGTVSHFPRGKLVMTSPAIMPLVGKVRFGEISKEKLLEFWFDIIQKYSLKINQSEAMLDVVKNEDGSFDLISSKNTYRTKSILLAIGRRGTPRKLGVAGEECSKVVYRLTDPEQYNNDDVLIVGGGDSALEAACSIAELGQCRVSISYRNDSFNRAKQKNRRRVEKLVEQGLLTLYMASNIKSISAKYVKLIYQADELTLINSAVIICAGGVLPTPFLKKIGIQVLTKYGAA